MAISSDSLDTSAIVHCIIDDVPGQREKVLELLNNPRAVHYVSDMAIAEALYALEEHYYLERDDAVNRLAVFLERYGNCLRHNHDLTELAFPFYLEHPKLSFYDCCLASYAELEGAEPLFTFDKTLARQHPSAKLLF